jgi:hypothetical protein
LLDYHPSGWQELEQAKLQTRSSTHWQTLPGSFDMLHSGQVFPSENPYGIPSLPHAPLRFIPTWLAPYRTRIRSVNGKAGGAVHFFLDDYRFETVWSRPHKALEYLRKFQTLLTPDFSVYADMPHTLQLWNVYRNRWCGAWWAAQGFRVIPTVSWAGRESYPFGFAGIARHSIVALSTVGVRAHDQRQFARGFHEMLARIQPVCVLCYGKLPDDLARLVEARCYPTRWDGIQQARRNGR